MLAEDLGTLQVPPKVLQLLCVCNITQAGSTRGPVHQIHS